MLARLIESNRTDQLLQVLVMMPKSRWMSFVAKRVVEGSVPGVETLARLLESYKRDTGDAAARSDLQLFCETIAHQTRRESSQRWQDFKAADKLPLDFKVMLFTCGVWLGNEKLCKRFLWAMEEDMPDDMFNKLREPLLAKFAQFRQLLLDAFCQMGTITEVWKCLQEFLGPDHKNPELHEWSTTVLAEVLQTSEEMTAADAHTLMSLSNRYGTDFQNTW
jgi:hypothetical protein